MTKAERMASESSAPPALVGVIEAEPVLVDVHVHGNAPVGVI
jgi:hypothetical protein